MSLLGDEEIIKLIVQWREKAEGVNPDNPSLALDVADLAMSVREAQHAKDQADCQKRVEEIFGGIEGMWLIKTSEYDLPYIKIDYAKYQNFKSKHLRKEGGDEG